jgi:hypothetical protein
VIVSYTADNKIAVLMEQSYCFLARLERNPRRDPAQEERSSFEAERLSEANKLVTLQHLVKHKGASQTKHQPLTRCIWFAKACVGCRQRATRRPRRCGNTDGRALFDPFGVYGNEGTKGWRFERSKCD